ncbi:hypothetical protein CW751_13125 [Brumimicrobium salinarum]|uniref:Lipoprotein n=1 Tax=Brumimicrobium salinarum TaxID=2058658 RepID=A0A2I0QZL3_9FLAO|nr:hypothetical protein [Brumimicrobium salinarum]PKR79772.1 hypothetical protein CW751_13125 [Brumimicrobium salinarum]
MVKNSILILTFALFVIGCGSNNSFELVERWYTVEEGKQLLSKEIFWEDFDKKIKSKEIEYLYSHKSKGTCINIYNDSLLTKVYMIDDIDGIDTFNIIDYYYDKHKNLRRYTHIPDDEIVNVDCKLILDSVNFKPISRTCHSSNGNSFRIENEYFPNREISRTYVKDSLTNYVTTYFDQNNKKIARYRKFLTFDTPSSDSFIYEHNNGKLIKETMYFRDTLSSYKNYFYNNDTLVKVTVDYVNKDKSTIKIQYSEN